MRSNRFTRVIFLALVSLMLPACSPTEPSQAARSPEPTAGFARYHLTARSLDVQALDGYPQHILRTFSTAPPYELEIEVRPDPDRARPIYWAEYDYPSEAAPYRLASPQVESSSPGLCDWANTFYIYEGDIVSYGVEVLLWISQNIQPDPGLEAQVNTGQVHPVGAAHALKSQRAASADLAHLFIAAMRCQGVPARFVSGYVYPAGYQSWAEVYLYGIGWAPADPLEGVFGITPAHIRLFAGVDFNGIGLVPVNIDLEISAVTNP